MILGVGSDLINTERVRRSVTSLGHRWVNKILLPAEIERSPSRNDAVYVSKLFAAKEACSKAIGTGMADGVHWHNIEITLPNSVELTGDALGHLKGLVEGGKDSRILLDVFCRKGFCCAIAIAIQIPQNGSGLTFPTLMPS